jgi:hypothetical protein
MIGSRIKDEAVYYYSLVLQIVSCQCKNMLVDHSQLVTRKKNVQGKPPKGNLKDPVLEVVLPPVLEVVLPPVLEVVLPPALMHEPWIPEFPPAVSHTAF